MAIQEFDRHSTTAKGAHGTVNWELKQVENLDKSSVRCPIMIRTDWIENP
jgi:hypothetical protein